MSEFGGKAENRTPPSAGCRPSRSRSAKNRHSNFAPRSICLYGHIHGQAGRAKLLLLMHRPPLDHGPSDLVPQRRRKVGDRDPDHVAIAGGIAEPLRRTEIKTKAPSMAQR